MEEKKKLNREEEGIEATSAGRANEKREREREQSGEGVVIGGDDLGHNVLAYKNGREGVVKGTFSGVT